MTDSLLSRSFSGIGKKAVIKNSANRKLDRDPDPETTVLPGVFRGDRVDKIPADRPHLRRLISLSHVSPLYS